MVASWFVFRLEILVVSVHDLVVSDHQLYFLSIQNLDGSSIMDYRCRSGSCTDSYCNYQWSWLFQFIVDIVSMNDNFHRNQRIGLVLLGHGLEFWSSYSAFACSMLPSVLTGYRKYPFGLLLIHSSLLSYYTSSNDDRKLASPKLKCFILSISYNGSSYSNINYGIGTINPL